MVKLQLARDTVQRLARYIQSVRPDAPRTDHWRHYGAMNSVTAVQDSSSVIFTAGPGFDSDYELTFRRRSVREICGSLWRKFAGSDPAARWSAAFVKIWRGESPVSLEAAAAVLGAPLTAQKIIAAHYANLLLPHLAPRNDFFYLEIGPGSGYLAALIHHYRPGPMVLIDLADILPFSFLTLHRIFPADTFFLPNEARSPVAITGRNMVFLTSAQTGAVPDDCADLSVNTASFGEMLPEQIHAYFSLLRRAGKPTGLFFTSNRVEKWMKRPGIAGDDIPIRFEEYPWLPADQDVFFRLSEFHALVQPDPVYSRLCRLAGSEPAAARR
jgi:hypothetical protein